MADVTIQITPPNGPTLVLGTTSAPTVLIGTGTVGGGGGGSGTVTNVGLSLPAGFSVAGSPITGSGTFTVSYASGYQGYTSAEASKLAGIATGANVNVNADWDASSGDAQILNKPTIPAAYTLPTASSSTLGGVKIGANVTISSGTISVAAPVTNNVGLTNGAGYLTSYTETDPTVPSWAKQATKPSYTAAEVGAVPTTRTINGNALSADVTLTASDVGAEPSNADLTAIAGLSGTGYAQRTGAGTWTLSTPSGGSGTVTSVGLTVPTGFSVAGSPVTVSGTLAVTENTQSANLVKAGPSSGAAAVPTYRALVAADLPTTAVTAGSYGDSTHVATFTVDGAGRLTAAGSTAIAAGGSGTVTSVALTVPSWLTVTGSPVTGAGTLAVAATGAQTANQFLATPNGSTGAVGLRAIAASDIPTLNQSTTGNAATATKLATARTIAGVSFDGSADIAIPFSGLTGTSGVTQTIASGTAALGTSAIASGASASVVTAAATGVATTDVIDWGFNGDPTAVTGYVPSANGMLTIIAYPTAGNVNFVVTNNTAASVTPGAITLNWRVLR